MGRTLVFLMTSITGRTVVVRQWLASLCAVLISAQVAPMAWGENAAKPIVPEATSRPVPRMIGATTIVTEVTSGLALPARVDTGATSCSIHCQKYMIKGAVANPKENIGKRVRLLISDKQGKAKWIQAKIADHVTIRTPERDDERYKVRLRLRWNDFEKKVLVTLNDRENMKYPLLLGRNFLRDDFLVNVSQDVGK
jgi:hypothetical protein